MYLDHYNYDMFLFQSTIRRVYVDNITGTILLDSNNVIRNCITTEMMGTMSDDVLIHPMKAPTDIDTGNTYGERSFQHAAPKEWNNLPLDIRDSPSLAIFKSRLKTFLFKSAFIL